MHYIPYILSLYFKNAVRRYFLIARFGACRANLFTYPIFTNFKTLVCTNIFRSGNLLSKRAETHPLAPASMFTENAILTLKSVVRFIRASNLKKVSALRRVLFSKYLYVSPYWAWPNYIFLTSYSLIHYKKIYEHSRSTQQETRRF